MHCEIYLPFSLVTLTLASNNLVDLNEVSHLVHLVNLRELSITGNPCVTMTGNYMYPFCIFKKLFCFILFLLLNYVVGI